MDPGHERKDGGEGADENDLLARASELRRLAGFLVRDDATADDLAQDAWLESRTAAPGDKRNLRAWLFGLVRNVAREGTRADARRRRREEHVARAEAERPEDVVERVETFRMLAEEASRLEEPYRSAILLRFFDGLSAEEIARAQGVPSATVRSRQKRGLDLLRERLDRRPGGRERWLASLAALLPLARGPRRAWPLATAFVASTLIVAFVVASRWDREPPAMPAALVADTSELAPAPAASEPLALAEPLARTEANASQTIRAAPVSVRLVDARTGAAVARSTLVVRSASGREVIETDADGRARSELAHPLGTIGIEVLDDPRNEARPMRASGEERSIARSEPFEHASAAERELRAAFGPTYELVLSGGGFTCDELVAELSRDGAGERASAPVRCAGRGRAWVRFRGDALAIPGPGAVRVFVGDADARVGGEAEASSIDGGETLRVRLEALADLDVEVVDAAGRALLASVEVERDVRRLAAGPSWDASFRGLVAGPVTLVARLSTSIRASQDLELVAGANRARIVVPGVEAAGSIVVRVECDDDAGPLPESVVVQLDGGSNEFAIEAAVRASDERTNSRTFAFDGVRAGEHALALPSVRGWRFEPWRATVATGSAPLVVRATRADAGVVLVKPVDRASGARIDHAVAWIERDDGTSERRASSLGAVTFAGLAREARFRWRVAAVGWVGAAGDASALVTNGDRREIRVALERGFARRIVVRERGAPVAGVEVVVDDERLGATDASGTFDLRRPAEPRALFLVRGGARVSGGELRPDGSWTSSDLEHIAVEL